MGPIKNQFKSEIKQLPFILGKVAGGVLAVIGFAGMSILVTHSSPPPSWRELWPLAALGVVGVIVFSLSSIKLKKQLGKSPETDLNRQGKKQVSLLSWTIFLIFIIIFISITFIMNS
jgi:hypothetical protein